MAEQTAHGRANHLTVSSLFNNVEGFAYDSPLGVAVAMQYSDLFVNEDGSLSDISAHDCKINRFNTTRFSQETESKQKEVKEQFAKLFAKEGYRLIKKMPKWTPGKLNGKVVRTKYNLPINFVNPHK